ncbi:type I restriction endonuclease subunit R [Anoxybacillus sp. FSL W8-0104]|uniref:type I restriction endonuclease subunit R n=1 Tax=Anoxybacillus sp. FSL W8-0104 TaxID=2954594 RepID=UPI0030F8E608
MTAASEWNELNLVEKRLINQLQELGYEHVPGSALESERDSLSEVILKERLKKAIQRLNPWIDDNNLARMIYNITHIEATGLMQANEKFHEMLVNYISVQQDLGKGKKNQTVKLIDFDNPYNNEFLVVDQFRIQNARGTIRPDVVIFVNGLPLVVIECKSPTLQEDTQISKAVNQLRRYQETHEQLFYYNQFMIATSNYRAKAGTIGAKVQHYGEWKDPYPRTVPELGDSPTKQDILVAGMLSKENLLDLIQNFIVYEVDGGRVIKKIARYQQFRAVNKAIHRILHAKTPKDRGGVIWHTQGSGKSLTMLYLAVKLRRIKELHNPTIVVVTDRKDLDDQITKTFRKCGFPNPQQAESVKDLKRLLQQGPGSTIMTLVQKFQPDKDQDEYPELSRSENIFVLVDESHRTQYKGLAMNMRKGLPNACYIGFTGTPIDKEDKSTTRTFGSYIDKYTIEQAVDDGATVPIFYEARMVNLHLQGESLDRLFDRKFSDYSEEDRERIKKKYAKEEAILAAPSRIEQIALDIVEHFENYILPNGFKAQVVAVNREAAAIYKQKLDELINGKYETALIISTGPEDKNNELLKDYSLSREEEKQLIERFKKPFEEDKLAILIVCDKLLTGFDAPIEQVMYLDKPLKEHNLLQAIARTNRTYEGKTYGLIVDYFGVSKFLEKALAIFSKQDIQGALLPIESELPKLKQAHRKAMSFFDYINRSDADACVQVLEPEDVRHEFEKAFKEFSKRMDMILPNREASPYIEDLKFLGKVRQMAKTLYRDEQMDISECGEKVKQLIAEHLYAESVEVIHEPIDILSSKFDERLKKAPSKEAQAAEMEHAIRHEIKVKLEENPVYYTSLREKLEQLIEARRKKMMDIAELVEKLRSMVNDMRNVNQQAQNLGFTREQYPFYQLFQQLLPDEEHKDTIDALTHLVTDMIAEESQVIDWVNKEDVKREMRKKIKKQLRASVIPKDQIENVTQQIMSLAMVHYKR